MNEQNDIYGQRDQIFKDIKDKLDQIYLLLQGDGSKDNPGVLIRMDRLEQWKVDFDKEADRSWQWRIGLAIPLVVLLIERAVHYVRGVPH